MREFFDKFNNFKKTKYGSAILFFSFYLIFFIGIILSSRVYGNKNFLNQEYEKGRINYNSIKIPVENFRYDYNVLLDDINYNYYGKIDGDVQSFKFNNSDYYKLKDDYYVNNGTWIKTNNPYKFYELIDFDNINKILENASFISKDNESKKTTYKYLISSNTINKLVYGVDTDYDEVPNQVSVEFSNGGISKIEMRLDSLCKLNNVCQKSLTLDLNYELYNSVSQIDNPIE